MNCATVEKPQQFTIALISLMGPVILLHSEGFHDTLQVEGSYCLRTKIHPNMEAK